MDRKIVPKIYEEEEKINFIQSEITPYLVRIQSLPTITEENKSTILSYHNLATFIERIGDHDKNIAEFALERLDKGAVFSEEALQELRDMCHLVDDALHMAMDAFEKGPSHDTVARSFEFENKVDNQHTMMRENHIRRLNSEQCNAGRA